MWPKIKKQNKSDELPDLVLSSPEGSPWIAYPPRVVDPIRLLISRIGRNDEIPPRISFVAALRREGVSYHCRAFATTMANDLDTTVCIVDMNWWWPTEFSINIPDSGGFGSVLTGEITLESAVVKTGKPNIAILPAGKLSVNERAYFARSSILKDALLELNARYDHLVLDIPAVLASHDAIPLASFGTAFCLVIHQGVTSIEEVKSALSDLDHIPNIGVIMNKSRSSTPEFILKFLALS